MTAADPRYLATAIEVVTAAGAIQRARFGQAIRIDKKGTIDLVTEVDVEVERAARALLASRFPDHDILAEELGGGRPGASHRWVFDPLDGTTNFAHGLPVFSVSIACEVAGRVRVGVVFAPLLGLCFAARRGGGATCNGQPLRTSAVGELDKALLATGFPYDRHTSPENNFAQFAAFKRRAQGVRRLGSAALDQLGASPEFIQQHQAVWSRVGQNPQDLSQVSREGGKALGDALVISDIGPDGGQERQSRLANP